MKKLICFSLIVTKRTMRNSILLQYLPEIADTQHSDKHLHELFKCGDEKNMTTQYQVSIVEDTKVLTGSNLKLVLPASLRMRPIEWYHHWLQYPGQTRLEKTIRHVFTWPNICGMVRRFTKS